MYFSSILQPLHHYDWGLRALKAVINLCRVNLKLKSSELRIIPDENEQLNLVVQSLKLNTISKLSYQDTIRFVLQVFILFNVGFNIKY